MTRANQKSERVMAITAITLRSTLVSAIAVTIYTSALTRTNRYALLETS
jgi:hypothetical protein